MGCLATSEESLPKNGLMLGTTRRANDSKRTPTQVDVWAVLFVPAVTRV